MNSKAREDIKNKFGGHCAYTGKPLDEKWQIDHMHPKCLKIQSYNGFSSHDDLENLVPAIRIVNHYKRSLDLEGFRSYMIDFHLRLNKLPKKTTVNRTLSRIEYMKRLADLFEISETKPFDGKFYFEKL